MSPTRARSRRFAELRPEQAQQVLDIRDRLGRLHSVDDLVVHGDVDPAVADRLREYAVFL